MVIDFLGHLSSSPGSFESDVEYITGILNSWVTNEELLQELVELIYTQVWRCMFSSHVVSLCKLNKHFFLTQFYLSAAYALIMI